MNRGFWISTVLVALAGCASHAPAPVIERAGPGPSPASAPAAPAVPAVPAVPIAPVAPKAGHYVVKKGDTLYGIALDHGIEYRELVAWNTLEDPNRIVVGQQLRVKPLQEEALVAVAKPVSSPGAVEVRPLEASAPARTEQAAPPGKPAPPDRTVEKAVPAAAGEDAVDWAWPVNGKVITSFVEGGPGRESNKGIDISGRMGDPVQAAAGGRVVYVGSGLRGYGNLVIVRHNAAFFSAYAHNSKVLVKEGQTVAKGQKIAEVGSSDTDSPKLHFEIRRQGRPVDPLKHLPPAHS